MGLAHQSPSELMAFFTHSLASFQSSPDLFRILLTLPPLHPHPHPHPHPQGQHARPSGPSTRQRLVVLDSSFNPPTTAHARMALSALRAQQHVPASADPDTPAPRTRLVLLLAVQNADKAPDKPAALAQRLCMMDVFARGLQRAAASTFASGGDAARRVPIDVAVTKSPFFCDKARAMAGCEAYAASSSGGGSGSSGDSPQFSPSPSPSPHPPTTPRSTPIPALWQLASSGGSLGPVPAAAAAEQQPQMVFLVGFDTVVRILDPKYYPGGMAPALAPLFARARLRVTGRPHGGWGSAAEQERWVAGLAAGLAARGGDASWAGRIELVRDDERGREGEGEGVSSSRAREVVRAGELDKLEGLVDDGVREWIVKGGLYT
ncbi:POF1 -like protein [Escovopsis weberi]|uniref:POF1-like protein n=1 Tax=Escovopsis weberi TaxID=150374 RepID=A0A0M9VWR8_ESCWE|nr:POF1 -like protein [Escovopsis weberi]